MCLPTVVVERQALLLEELLDSRDDLLAASAYPDCARQVSVLKQTPDSYITDGLAASASQIMPGRCWR